MTDLRVLTYNVFMRPTTVFHDGQWKRVVPLAAVLATEPCDVLVLNEAFDDDVREKLLGQLNELYPHRTDVVGSDWGFGQDGGVMVLSRHPIVQEEQMTFDIFQGWDGLADKGVMYAKVRKESRPFHVFATHLDSGKKGRKVRQKQMRMIRDFIDAMSIPDDQPVIVAGDFNVGSPDRLDEKSNMLEILRAVEPKLVGAGRFSVDPTTNSLCDGDPRQRDFVLWSVDHAQPDSGSSSVWALKSAQPWEDNRHKPTSDLSDHYPVVGRFEWPS